jgi:ATP-dependent DNA ligase
MRLCRWVEPNLVCQVRLTEWTRDGKLRHPVFQDCEKTRMHARSFESGQSRDHAFAALRQR